MNSTYKSNPTSINNTSNMDIESLKLPGLPSPRHQSQENHKGSYLLKDNFLATKSEMTKKNTPVNKSRDQTASIISDNGGEKPNEIKRHTVSVDSKTKFVPRSMKKKGFKGSKKTGKDKDNKKEPSILDFITSNMNQFTQTTPRNRPKFG